MGARGSKKRPFQKEGMSIKDWKEQGKFLQLRKTKGKLKEYYWSYKHKGMYVLITFCCPPKAHVLET
jgi:hypothetical protein